MVTEFNHYWFMRDVTEMFYVLDEIVLNYTPKSQNLTIFEDFLMIVSEMRNFENAILPILINKSSNLPITFWHRFHNTL